MPIVCILLYMAVSCDVPCDVPCDVMWVRLQMLAADFCQLPTDNALMFTPPDVYDTASYYATCNGTNPVTQPLKQALLAIAIMNASIYDATQPGGACPNNQYLISCYSDINNIYYNLTEIATLAYCPP